MMRAVDHVGFHVADLDRALDFWCGHLGLRLLNRGTYREPDLAALIGEEEIDVDIADLDAGDGQIVELIQYTRPAALRAPARGADARSSHVAVRVNDLAAVLAGMEGTQARQISHRPVVLADPGGPWDGVMCCYIADPDGIVVELVQRPVAGAQ
jgi:lactoylglutathione lyase